MVLKFLFTKTKKALETPNSKEIITPKPGGKILLVQTKCTWILPKTEEGDGGRCSWFQGSSKQCRCIKSYPDSSIGLVWFGVAGLRLGSWFDLKFDLWSGLV